MYIVLKKIFFSALMRILVRCVRVDYKIKICYNVTEKRLIKNERQRKDTMKVLGIDPGYAIVGYGVVEYKGGKYSPIDFGAITTDAEMPFPKRLQYIYNELVSVIIRNDPDEMSIERLYFQNNQKTAIAVAEARGVILLAAQMNNIPISEYTPLQVKQAVTGYGQAKKPQVMEMTRRLLKLEKVPKPDDTADALAIAICHVQTSDTRIINMLNKRNRINFNSVGGLK